ncbi:MAG: YicC family protein [Polyangiaceae bacterium]|nr:YicC family protein [Polyangiaceae bacterium]
MRSMTGFGFGDASFAGGRITIEIRTANQRFLDVRARLPNELTHFTMFVEQLVREHVRRGRVDVVLRAEGLVTSPPVLDRSRARLAMRELAELRDEIAPGADLPLSLLAAVPGLFSVVEMDAEAVRAALRTSVAAALAALEGMQLREGEALAKDLSQRAARIADLLVEVRERAESLPGLARRRAEEKLARMLGGTTVAVDAARVESELLLLADRSDVTEELTRLSSHVAQFQAALAETAEPVGRKLDFLLQEMLREAHTVAAKAQDQKVSEKIVTFKVELERLREQVQNIE